MLAACKWLQLWVRVSLHSGIMGRHPAWCCHQSCMLQHSKRAQVALHGLQLMGMCSAWLRAQLLQQRPQLLVAGLSLLGEGAVAVC